MFTNICVEINIYTLLLLNAVSDKVRTVPFVPFDVMLLEMFQFPK